MRHLFFDLDGTLTDPKRGFVHCLGHALRAAGVSVPADEVLASFIGPPLEQTLRQLLGARTGAELTRAVDRYDECYAAHGVRENRVYPDADAGLGTLVAKGFTVRVVTSKRQDFARQVVEHFDLAKHVAEVVGFENSGSTTDKAQLIRTLLGRHAFSKEQCCMVGDRSYDVIAARQNAIRAIGVLWGYGSRSELEAAGAELVVESWHELVEFFGSPR